MKKVIVPTDFSLESLHLLDYTLINYPNTKLEIIMVCGLQQPESKWGLLHFNLLAEKNRIVSEEFLRAKNQYVREHKDRINNVRIEFFTGNNAYAFQNFMEGESVENAIVPSGEFLSFRGKKVFDPIPFIRKCTHNLVEAPLGKKMKSAEVGFPFYKIFRATN